MAITKLPLALRMLQGPSLVNDEGQGYSPSNQPGIAGMDIQGWGYDQALKQRSQKRQQFLENRGNPLFGFLRPANVTALPNKWEVYGQVMRGRSNAAQEAGAGFRSAPIGNAPAPNTRWDSDQIDAKTGNTLTQDTYKGRPDLQIPLYRLRQLHGL